MIRVQQEDFDIGAEIARLKAGRSDIGAIVTFTGTVRDQAGAVAEMTLEHYPGMTEAELSRIEAEANARWPLQASLIVHRYGSLKPGDNIVLVVTASEHRDAAFEAARVSHGLSQDAARRSGSARPAPAARAGSRPSRATKQRWRAGTRSPPRNRRHPPPLAKDHPSP